MFHLKFKLWVGVEKVAEFDNSQNFYTWHEYFENV